MVSQLAPETVERQLDIRVASATDVGGRAENEDAVAVRDLPAVDLGEGTLISGILLVLADGMGGHQRGEVASEIAVETTQDVVLADPAGDVVPLLKQAFRRANEQIFGGWQGQVQSQMMGTTLIAVIIRGKYATVASIGDSRAYLIRAGRLQQVTRDHTLVADQVAAGNMTAEEARESPHRNIITHALGHKAKLDSRMPNVFEIVLLEEDRLFICSDGFFDVVPDDDLLRIIEETDPETVADRLVGIAKERGTSDNVSAVVASVIARPDFTLSMAQTKTLGSETGPSKSPAWLPLIAAVLLLITILVVVAYFAI